jgi:hypothetical protein
MSYLNVEIRSSSVKRIRWIIDMCLPVNTVFWSSPS